MKRPKPPKKNALIRAHFAERQKSAFLTKRIMRWFRECRDLLQARGIPSPDDKAMDLFAQHCRPAGTLKWPEPADVVRNLTTPT